MQKTERIQVNENLIKGAYGEATFQHIISMHQTNNFTQAPRNVLFYINNKKVNKKVLRLPNIAPQSRSVVDTEALVAIVQAELDKLEKEKKEDEEQRIAEGRPLPLPLPPRSVASLTSLWVITSHHIYINIQI